MRKKRAKLNIIFSLLSQFVTLVCGLIVPRLLLGAFGSEAYGATASITQFLAYITLLEGGIGGVARAALYKPLAENDNKTISDVIYEIRAYFRVIAIVFIVYVLVLACTYKSIAHVQCFDWVSTFTLVIVISISTFAQYFIGISYAVLLQAAQRTYITQITSSAATIVNAACIVMLVHLNSSLIIIKLVSSFVFAVKPFVLWLYVRKNFNLEKTTKKEESFLRQKWTALGQHIAFFLHSNTDIAVLTILDHLTSVAVYSVYNMIVSQIQNVTSSFSTGMESVFGDMLAKSEFEKLHKTFDIYESLISIVGGTLFSVTAVMIVPFIKIYTKGITDVEYIYPLFALLLILSSYLYCLRMPYHSMIIAAGHFKQTRFAAYGEAVINIILSIVLVIRFNLVGVAIGTVVATCFRFVWYVIYLSKHIFYRKIRLFAKRFLVNTTTSIIIIIACGFLIRSMTMDTYLQWIVSATIVFIIAVLFEMLVLFGFYRNTIGSVFRRLIKK